MATQAEYDAAADAITKLIQSEIHARVPMLQGLIPAAAIPVFARECAKDAVDASEKVRAAPK